MEFFETIKQRESCRNYDGRMVEKEKLLACVEAAQAAPSACNSQPWSYIVVTNKDLLPQVAKITQAQGLNKFTNQCPAFVVVVEEPAYLIGSKKEPNQKFASIDIGLSVGQLCLAATAQGLSTCIMGSFAEADLKQLLAVPEEKNIRLVLAVGYAADSAVRPKKRKPVEQIARFEE